MVEEPPGSLFLNLVDFGAAQLDLRYTQVHLQLYFYHRRFDILNSTDETQRMGHRGTTCARLHHSLTCD